MTLLRVALVAVGTVAVASSFWFASRPGESSAAFAATVSSSKVGTDPGQIKESASLRPKAGDELAIFSGGCFWGVEEHFRQVPGVVATAVGYTGGNVPHPSYELVCTHTTGHAESVLVEFDPKKISYRALVDSFWKVTDPTTVNRQGPDVGSNYRSAIWYFNEDQHKDILASIAARQKKESGPIVTEVKAVKPFYLAEDYHQQYDEKTGTMSCPVRE